jgi:phage tail-like protein
MADPAVSLRFHVEIDGQDLGYFTSCEGLGAEYDLMTYTEGGENSYEHKLPGRLKYTTIKLSRPIDKMSGALAAWFASLQAVVRRQSASIKVYDGNSDVVAEWNLQGVWPMRWTGPSLSVDGGQVAKETLELAHNGFLGDLKGAAAGVV